MSNRMRAAFMLGAAVVGWLTVELRHQTPWLAFVCIISFSLAILIDPEGRNR